MSIADTANRPKMVSRSMGRRDHRRPRPASKTAPGRIEISLRKFSFEPAPGFGSYVAAMAAPTPRNFSFICGRDDFLVGRMGRKRYDELAGGAADEFSQEIVNGFAANVDEVEVAVNRFREAIQTMPMFGGQRVVWLKDVNFL